MSIEQIESVMAQLELGKHSTYDAHYNPDKLLAIPRKPKRKEIGVPDVLPFLGYDIWNHYEVSWLNQKGKPQVAMAEIIYPCDSPNIIESKSMKLYFNSLNNTQFQDISAVQTLIQDDISKRIGCKSQVKILPLPLNTALSVSGFTGHHIDHLDIEIQNYTVSPDLLSTEDKTVHETICSDLLKSNCLVTGQPDWASIQIEYRGKKINHENLLKYIISYRNHNEFHEQCIERIFMDIMLRCQPTSLTVYGRFTRRGGLDINPLRSTEAIQINNMRHLRQ
jgi:7-cyano-7-deazaguanine reductase